MVLAKMRLIADLHIHGRYSRATSEKMCINEISRFAKVKGLNLVGTGDFTHPKWLQELRHNLIVDSTGLYSTIDNPHPGLHFIVTTEVSTIFPFNDDVKKVHHVILAPSIETAIQINDRLGKYGDLEVDGRATLDMSAPHLVEEVMSVSADNVVFPAHAWTPWFSIFGAFSGFNRVEECYQDMTKHIHAIETGLSSDPPMNWRLNQLDKFVLVSNSDSHSHWPWRIGREANVFELEHVSFDEVRDAMTRKDSGKFSFTIETDPAYGKYHWSGHRNCHVSLSPQDAVKFGNVCPVCRKRLTKGVAQRVEELADRAAGFRSKGAVGYVHLLPLSEVISTVLGVDSPYSSSVWSLYDPLVKAFGSEYAVLLDTSQEDLNTITDPRIADAVAKIRCDKAKVVPGYDGVYGKLDLGEEKVSVDRSVSDRVQQLSISDFLG